MVGACSPGMLSWEGLDVNAPLAQDKDSMVTVQHRTIRLRVSGAPAVVDRRAIRRCSPMRRRSSRSSRARRGGPLMRALCFDRFGGPEVLTLRQVPDPLPVPGHAVVRTEAIG